MTSDFNSVYATEATTSHAQTLPATVAKVVVHALMSDAIGRRCTQTRDLERCSGRSEFICFEPRVSCQGVAREMPMTPAEVAYNSDRPRVTDT